MQELRCALFGEKQAERIQRGEQNHAAVIALVEVRAHLLRDITVQRFIQKVWELSSDFAAIQKGLSAHAKYPRWHWGNSLANVKRA